MDEKPGKLRLTLGWMILLVAVIAIAVNALRPSQTKVEDLKAGFGPGVQPGDMVTVHYVGRLTSGKEFDSSKPRGQPFEFGVGRGRVIKGWDLGLIGMKAGGVRRLTIPPEEAYGKAGAPLTIPPNSTLIFEIELLKIK